MLDTGEHHLGSDPSQQQPHHLHHHQQPHQLQHHPHNVVECSPRFLVPNATPVEGAHPNRNKHKLSRSQVSEIATNYLCGKLARYIAKLVWLVCINMLLKLLKSLRSHTLWRLAYVKFKRSGRFSAQRISKGMSWGPPPPLSITLSLFSRELTLPSPNLSVWYRRSAGNYDFTLRLKYRARCFQLPFSLANAGCKISETH